MRTLSVFLDSDAAPEDVRKALEAIVEQPFRVVINEWGTNYDSDAFGMHLRMFRGHGLEEDFGIPFPRFAYQIRMEPDRGGLAPSEFAARYEPVASLVASKLCEILGGRALIVEDLQRIVGSFGVVPL